MPCFDLGRIERPQSVVFLDVSAQENGRFGKCATLQSAATLENHPIGWRILQHRELEQPAPPYSRSLLRSMIDLLAF
jgi:hypothetical protein